MNLWSSRTADREEKGKGGAVREHPFVLIANHQLSEKRSAPKIRTSILTSRRVARVRNFTSRQLPPRTDMCSGYISHPAPLSILFVPLVRLSRFRWLYACACARAPVPISAYLGSRGFGVLRNAAPIEMYPNKCPKRSRNVAELEDYSLHSGRQLILERIVSEEKVLFSSKKKKR